MSQRSSELLDDRGLRGVLIKESLDDGNVLNGVRVTKTTEFNQPQPSPDQPSRWTLIWFEGSDSDADSLADSLSHALKPRGWYIDFSTSTHKYVVLPGKVFKYAVGDKHAEESAKAFARTVGVPDRQLDWR
jgi:hypothetical protein